MGHGSIRTTMDLYGHLFETLESQRYERMNAALRNGGGHVRGTRAVHGASPPDVIALLPGGSCGGR
jgi:hypothetical protein